MAAREVARSRCLVLSDDSVSETLPGYTIFAFRFLEISEPLENVGKCGFEWLRLVQELI